MRRVVWGLLVAAVIAAVPLAEGQLIGPSDKVTSEAEALLRVAYDPTSGLAPEAIVGPLLNGGESHNGGSLMRQTMTTAFPDIKEAPKLYVSAGLVSKDQGTLAVGVSIKSYDARVSAEKLLEPLAKTLAERLGELDIGHQRDEERLSRCAAEYEETGELLLRQREEVAKLAAVMGYVPPQLAEQRLLRIEAAAQAAGSELEGLKIRQAALERQIAKQAQRAEEGAANDPVVKELEKVVEIRVGNLSRAKQLVQKEAVAEQVVREAMAAVAEARAEVAKYRRAASLSAGGERLIELERRLEDTKTQLAETEAKHGLLKAQQKEAQPRDSVQIDAKKMEIEAYQERHRELFQEVYKLRAKLRSYQPPQVTIVPTT